MLAKLIQFVKNYQDEIVLVIGVILISLISFGLGRLTAPQMEKEPITIEEVNLTGSIQDRVEVKEVLPVPEELQKEVENQNQIVGNKNSKIYHYPWCSGAKMMK